MIDKLVFSTLFFLLLKHDLSTIVVIAILVHKTFCNLELFPNSIKTLAIISTDK